MNINTWKNKTCKDCQWLSNIKQKTLGMSICLNPETYNIECHPDSEICTIFRETVKYVSSQECPKYICNLCK